MAVIEPVERTPADGAIAQEVEALYLNGPAGGGGAVKSAREIVGIRSLLLPEGAVTPAIHILEA